MRVRMAVVSLFAALLAVVPAMAQQVLYTNGPINGEVDSWPINFGFSVSDSFTLSSQSNVQELMFGTFSFSGDVLETAEVSITSAEFGGTTYADETVSFTASNCFVNGFGFNVCTQTGTFPTGVNLAAGDYWLQLSNAIVNTGDPIYWDENSGPSQASFNEIGTIPSESFTLLGSSTSSGGSIPEPSSIMLFGSGILGVAGLVGRKLR